MHPLAVHLAENLRWIQSSGYLLGSIHLVLLNTSSEQPEEAFLLFIVEIGEEAWLIT